MRLHRLAGRFAAAAIGILAALPVASWAVAPSPPAEMGCTGLSAYLGGQPFVSEVTTTLVTTGTGARCELTFIYSSKGGRQYGYAEGQNQRIVLRVGLPLNTVDGGTGGIKGAWNGKVRNLGGGSLVGNVGSVTAATSTGYVGSSTDSGHPSTENPGFGVIQELKVNNKGRIEDFFRESLKQQYQWALHLAYKYYGVRHTANYWDGCSTGGRQGLVLAAYYGQDFDGFLVGAPHSSHTKTSSASVWRQWVNKDIAGGTVTPAKQQAAVSAAIAACDANDGVVDGILADPRTCKFSAQANVCGQPGAPAEPNCLTANEAKAIDMVWDGARNDKGVRVWPSGGKAALNSMTIGDNCGNNAVMCWIQKDMQSDWRTRPLSDWDDLVEFGTRTLSPLVDMRTTDLDRVRKAGAKILMWHGGSDPLINWEQSSYYYWTVAQAYGGQKKIEPWFRFFLAPGVGHCSGGVGPNPVGAFDEMVKWAESGKAPDSLPASGNGRTRPLCAWPKTAIYDGKGDPNLASSFRCGGNLDTREAMCQNYLIAKYQHETGGYDRSDKLAQQCLGHKPWDRDDDDDDRGHGKGPKRGR